MPQQAVRRIHADAEAGAANMVVDNVRQFWKEELQRFSVSCCGKILFDGMEVPQGGIGRMVQAALLAFRKHVGDQTIANVMPECPQDVSRLRVPACRER